MLSKQELDAALAAERAMYRALSEVQDITRELLDAVDRQDQVSVRLFLSMRQEQINQLRDQKELLKKLHQNIEEYRDVDLSENSRMPLGQWLDRWLEEYATPPHWKATRAISSAASSITWETSRWENLPWRMCENSTGNCKRIEEWRNIRFTVTACPVLWSAVSTGYSIRPWRRRCGKT